MTEPYAEIRFTDLNGGWHMVPTVIGSNSDRNGIEGRLLYDWRQYATPEALTAGPPRFRLELGTLLLSASRGTTAKRKDELYLSLIIKKPTGEGDIQHLLDNTGTCTKSSEFRKKANEYLKQSSFARVRQALYEIGRPDHVRLQILNAAIERLNQHRIIQKEATLASLDDWPNRTARYLNVRNSAKLEEPKRSPLSKAGGYEIPKDIPCDVTRNWTEAYKERRALQHHNRKFEALNHTLVTLTKHHRKQQ